MIFAGVNKVGGGGMISRSREKGKIVENEEIREKMKE